MKMMMNGVIAPMMADTRLTSNMPAASTAARVRPAPTHTGQSNCCAMFAPPPANITKPIENRVMIVVASRNQATHGLLTRRNTTVCSFASR